MTDWKKWNSQKCLTASMSKQTTLLLHLRYMMRRRSPRKDWRTLHRLRYILPLRNKDIGLSRNTKTANLITNTYKTTPNWDINRKNHKTVKDRWDSHITIHGEGRTPVKTKIYPFLPSRLRTSTQQALFFINLRKNSQVGTPTSTLKVAPNPVLKQAIKRLIPSSPTDSLKSHRQNNTKNFSVITSPWILSSIWSPSSSSKTS